ncbi:MAG TPA: protein kinase [Puia sp.]|uniref:serine/threonine protein kinase n=1 Tax=Puia sp. TaxID=2045100 RepID=UPI002C62480E|nr:protein kinase [Puia sp.]HVU99522.1 protein kinase [Puia sp.]
MLLFNRYQYQPSTDLIGRGQLTRVYKALDKQIYLPVALKIYRGSDPLDKVGLVNVKKFIAMDHPNICRYLHIEDVEKDGPLGEKERTQVCVMELVPDGDFGTYYRERKDVELLRRMVTDILRGLAYLHSKGIVHRRLKPSNLLVGETTQGPVVKITDFGLGSGKAALRDARLSSVVVEVTHMAPEQFNPRKYGVNGKVSYQIDFWAMGLVIYEALTNNDILFKNNPDDSREQVIQNILAPTLPEKIKRLPPPFDRVVARCLAKHADDRVQNTRELLELLSQPITTQDDVYETVVLPAMAREEAEEEREAAEYTESVVRAMVARVVKGEQVGGLASEASAAAALAAMKEAGAKAKSPAETFAAARLAAAPGAAAAVGAAAPGEAAVGAAAPGGGDVATTNRVDEPHVLFNRYEYNPRTGFIGKGGFSRVYKALDRKLDRWVALKLYKSGDSTDRYSPFAEIRRVINLDHPNICRYLDIEEMEKENAFGEKEVMQTCVMELLDGGNLHEYYAAHPTDEVLKKLLTDVLKGLEYLHKNGIIHRDIKPANILIKEAYDGPVAKITDFGISKLSDSINHHSSSALVVSIPYMAPEQLNVKKYGVDEKIGYNLDLWSLGVTIYEIITGKVLFKNSEGETSEQIMTNIMAPELPEKINELPQPFLEIVRRCVVKDARQRVQRAEELIELLHRPVVVAAPVVAPAAPIPIEVAAVEAVPAEVVPVQAAPDVTLPEPELKTDQTSEIVWPAWVEQEVAEAKPEEPYVPLSRVERPRRWRIAAIAAVVLLVAVGLYAFMERDRLKAAFGYSTLKTDSTNIVSGATPASAAPAPNTAAAAVDSSKIKSNAVVAAPDVAEKKPRKKKERVATETDETSGLGAGTTGSEDSTALTGTNPAATGSNPASTGSNTAGTTTTAKPKETNSGGTELTKYVLLLTTPATCSININNVPYGVLESGKTMKVYLSPGNYIIQATNTSNPSAVYTGRLVVQEENLNQVGKYTIPL